MVKGHSGSSRSLNSRLDFGCSALTESPFPLELEFSPLTASSFYSSYPLPLPHPYHEPQISVLHFLLLTRDVKVKCPQFEAFLEDVKKIAPLINPEIIWSLTMRIRVLFLTRKREVKEGKLPPVSFAPILLGIISGMAGWWSLQVFFSCRGHT